MMTEQQIRELAAALGVAPKEAARIWAELEEIIAGPSLIEMTEDLSTDLSALPEPVAAAIMLEAWAAVAEARRTKARVRDAR
jgi:hypothetical protein